MVKRFVRFAALASLLVIAGCGIQVGGVPNTFNRTPQWNAFVSQPSFPILLAPGQSVVIVVQLIPTNSIILTGPVFLNNFVGANGGIFATCPSIVSVATPIVGSPFNNVPTVLIPITPVGTGTCTLPVNLGLSGTVQIQIII